MTSLKGQVTPGQTASILRRFGLHPSKNLGQHFLTDDNILRKILESAQLKPTDAILEVGAGIGTLTSALAEKCRHVITVEFDRRLVPVLSVTIAPFENVNLIQKDALKLKVVDLEPVGFPNKMVSNLPYNIAAPLLIRYLEEFTFIKSYTIMIQREIADRIQASPENKNYGAYTIKLALLAEVKSAFNVSRQVFLPPPRVDSTVIRLIRRETDASLPRASLFKLIDGAFSQRRKKLVNAVSDSLNLDKRLVAEAVANLNFPDSIRAEKLTLKDFINLRRLLVNK